jgi:hypothetical protein
MSKEKQIEEMAKAICEHYVKGGCGRCPDCFCDGDALKLYNAGYRKLPDNIGDFSDGYHTFNELYHHRAVLFSVICNTFPEKAWKSKLHDTGDMYDGMFIVGIETEQGQATYHYDIEPYWDMFKVKELDKAPKWDGHTPSDAIERIGSMSCEGYRKQSEGEWHYNPDGMDWGLGAWQCSLCGCRNDNLPMDKNIKPLRWAGSKYCPNCEAKMKGGE